MSVFVSYYVGYDSKGLETANGNSIFQPVCKETAEDYAAAFQEHINFVLEIAKESNDRTHRVAIKSMTKISD